MKRNMKMRNIVKIIVVVVVLALMVAGGLLVVKKKKAELASTPGPVRTMTPVTVVRAPMGVFAVFEKYLGTVEPKLSADIAPRITARVMEVKVREGVRVDAGELLAMLDDREQRDAVIALEARLAAARTSAAALEAIYLRDRRLLEAKAVSRQAFDLSKSARDSARAEVTALGKQLHSAETALSYTRLEAPFNGIITGRFMDPGALAMPGKPVLSMESPDAGYYLEVRVPQGEIPLIREGGRVIVQPDGMRSFEEDNPEDVIVADVSRIHPAVRAGTMGVVEIDLRARPFGLPSGSVVSVRIQTGEKRGLKVPLNAMLEHGDSATVFVVAQDVVHLVPVKVLYMGDEWAVVRGDFDSEGVDVVNGVESALLRLHEGERVKLVAGLSDKGV
jgi:RND family efflux transporter MFP subunit